MTTGGKHVAEVPGIGSFIFRRRTMRDEFRIGAEFSRLTDGVATPVEWLGAFATAFATLKVLTEQAPEDWDMEGFDPGDDTTYTRILEVFGALRAEEARFRCGLGKTGKSNGPQNGGVDGAVVPENLQPAAQ